ncbi:MAG: hypothetical protein MMC23_001365 [Stictis urceolatum]|nr:hypothetical protein [Stictis urceolata]
MAMQDPVKEGDEINVKILSHPVLLNKLTYPRDPTFPLHDQSHDGHLEFSFGAESYTNVIKDKIDNGFEPKGGPRGRTCRRVDRNECLGWQMCCGCKWPGAMGLKEVVPLDQVTAPPSKPSPTAPKPTSKPPSVADSSKPSSKPSSKQSLQSKNGLEGINPSSPPAGAAAPSAVIPKQSLSNKSQQTSQSAPKLLSQSLPKDPSKSSSQKSSKQSQQQSLPQTPQASFPPTPPSTAAPQKTPSQSS